jgi:hypothetical protein
MEEELLYEFNEGPYEVLDFKVVERNEKAVIEVNDGELGRLPVEDLETVEQLRNALDKIETFLEAKKRRKQEL